jgi:hypothetical protein
MLERENSKRKNEKQPQRSQRTQHGGAATKGFVFSGFYSDVRRQKAP